MADFFEDTKKEEQDDDDLRICSSMECTGLIPALPENEDQLESYEELYPFLPPCLTYHIKYNMFSQKSIRFTTHICFLLT